MHTTRSPYLPLLDYSSTQDSLFISSSSVQFIFAPGRIKGDPAYGLRQYVFRCERNFTTVPCVPHHHLTPPTRPCLVFICIHNTTVATATTTTTIRTKAVGG